MKYKDRNEREISLPCDKSEVDRQRNIRNNKGARWKTI